MHRKFYMNGDTLMVELVADPSSIVHRKANAAEQVKYDGQQAALKKPARVRKKTPRNAAKKPASKKKKAAK